MSGANRTKQQLAASLLALMSTMPLEKISVNEIVENAGVGRNTFYYHFEDKYALVNWYFQTSITDLISRRLDASDWLSLISALEERLRSDKRFYICALEYTGQNSLRDYIFDFIRDLYIQRLSLSGNEKVRNMTETDKIFAGNFLAGSFLGLLLPWVHNGMKGSITDHYDTLRKICTENLLNEFFSLDDSAIPHNQ